MTFQETLDADVRKPAEVHMFNYVEPWQAVADTFEELSRTCVFCNFTARHRGSLKRHMVRMHLGS